MLRGLHFILFEKPNAPCNIGESYRCGIGNPYRAARGARACFFVGFFFDDSPKILKLHIKELNYLQEMG